MLLSRSDRYSYQFGELVSEVTGTGDCIGSCPGFLIILIAEICLRCPSLVNDDWVNILGLEVRTGITYMLGGTLLYDVIGEVSVLLVDLPVSLSPCDRRKF